MKHGKKYLDSAKLIQQSNYEPEEAIDLALQTAKAKFDETLEVSVRLGGGSPPRGPAGARHRGSAQRHRPHRARAGVRQGRQRQGRRGGGADYVGAEELVPRSSRKTGLSLTFA